MVVELKVFILQVERQGVGQHALQNQLHQMINTY
jgi:hypothetical protein